MNSIRSIQELGQSLWYDNIRRGLIDSGELAKLISQGITGVTSNPTIFEKAIDGSSDYDRAILKLASQGKTVDEVYDALVLEDIAHGADLLLPVYTQSQARDGYISIEVPPTLADNTEATVREAHRLFTALNRPNVMIKVPATPPGIPAIRRLIADGLNVNVTLIFSLDVHRDVINAYLAGLEDRLAQGLGIERIASVASFFVSRVDTLVDRLIAEGGKDASLAGKAGIANAKLAYQLFLEQFQSPRFERLRQQGAMTQRPLWASTSTKNPQYPDLLYVESLIGPETVDTLPPATIDAILDHGHAQPTLQQDPEGAKEILNRLEEQGITMRQVTDQLLQEGVANFHRSFITLKQSLEKKMGQNLSVTAAQFHLGSYHDAYNQAIEQLNHDGAIARLWNHDPTLWSDRPDHKRIISGALGWLAVPNQVVEDLPNLRAFFKQVVLDGFKQVVVLGMGGSSLVSNVISQSFPKGRPGLALSILDTTHAATIERMSRQLPLDKTLFIVASKSGSTTEPNAFYHYFWDLLERRGLNPKRQFVAITDSGTTLAKEATRQQFRHLFLNPADIGGRYSALSWFGAVPALLHGTDLGRLLAEAVSMSHACHDQDAQANPGVQLGAALATLAKAGRDKITLKMPQPIASFAGWLEQLLAESTGKSGTGLIPVADEPSLPVERYGSDRTFVVYQWQNQSSENIEELRAHGHPVIVLNADNPYQLGQEFYRWELATAIAGALMGIDAFDQPNVQESKDNTKALLATLDHGHLPQEKRLIDEKISWTASPDLVRESLRETLQALLNLRDVSSYIALMAYLDESSELDETLAQWRRQLASDTGNAVTLGYGPRFLHSTGQLHKGGPASGLFVQLVGTKAPRVAVPGAGFEFMTLMEAQALGDFQSLLDHKRPVVRIVLAEPASSQINQLRKWTQAIKGSAEVKP